MCISAAKVRATSITGEFDLIDDDKIVAQIELVCPLYAALKKNGVTDWQNLVALHTAHNIHVALQMEGVNGNPGAVTSESFSGVGSRSYAAPNQANGSDWWKGSSYGQLWYRYWIALPPGPTAIPATPYG